MKLQKSVWSVLLLTLAGIIYFVVFTNQNIHRHKEAFQWVNHTHEVIEDINVVRSSLLDLESQLRGFVITGNTVFIQDYQHHRRRLLETINTLQKKISDNPVQKENTTELYRLAQQKIAFQNEILRQRQVSAANAQTLIARLTGKRLTDSIETILQRMQLIESDLLTIRIKRNDGLSQVRYRTTIAVAAATLLLLSILLIKITAEGRRRRQAEEKAKESEKKYKGLIENSALVVYATDLHGNFTYLSGKCRELTGFTAEELQGENYLTLVEESQTRNVQAFYRAQIDKQTFETVLELAIKTKQGELRWIEQSVVLIQENGRPVGFQSIAKDITERKYAERLLADAEQRIKAKQEEYQERLQAILDNMPMIVYLKDLEGRFMMVNRQFHETFGTADEAVIGHKELNVHKTEASANKFAEADEKVRRTGKPVEVEEKVITRDGERHMLIVKFPLYDKANELYAISAVGKDITELIRYQRQLINAKQRAEQAERLQEEFLANMSHEIRTPMNGIIGMTNLLETTELTAEQREYLHLIKESSGILLMLINDILDLSKIKSGRMSVEKADYNLHQTIDSILAPFKVKAKEKGVQVSKVFQDLPQYVKGDQHKLQQVLNNLLSNAVKFTAQGAVSLFATTEQKPDGSLCLICSVTDTGIGISPENLEHVFESFVQAGSDMVRRFGGTGLGLAITRRLLELQGGKITVSSTLGEGSSFYFELPLQRSEDAYQERQPAETEIGEACNRTLTGKRILLIEDNLVNQKVTHLMLQKAGMTVDIANHGKEAVALLQKASYDLIITDLQMPEMDGFQTTAFIRTRLHLSTPIIAMTASALRNEKDRCFETGMNEYLTKPFAPVVLFHHLRRYLTDGEESSPEASLPATETKAAELYNLSYLEEMDDAEYAAEVLELFFDLTPTALAELKEAALLEEWSEVSKKAHSLKSSLGILQLNKLLATVTQIETKAKNETDTDTIETLLHAAARQYELVKPALEAELQSFLKQKPVL